jgi:heat shock protein HslJ
MSLAVKVDAWIAALSACLIIGCGASPGSAGSPMLVMSGSAERLFGVPWELKSLTVDGTRVIMHPDAPMEITFMPEGRVGGYGPVNQFQGRYEFSADGKLSWPGAGLAATRKAGPPELMDKERAFFAGLGKVSRAILAGDALQLQSEDGNTVLAFVKAGT